MKISLFSKRIDLKSSGATFRFGSSPEADWKIIFLLTSLLVIIGIIVNAYIFIKLDKGEIFLADAPATEGKNTLNIAELKATVEYYRSKSDSLQNILQSSSTTTVVDPSL